MKKLLATLALFGAMGTAWAEDAPVAAPAQPAAAAAPAAAPAADAKVAPAATAAAPAPATPAAAAAPAAAPAAATPAPTPVPNKGDNAWLMVSSALVILMSIPGLALFYGGLVRSKNMLSVLMQVFVVFALISVLWVVYGYSLAFTQGTGPLTQFIGSFSDVFLKATTPDSTAATFSKGAYVSELAYVVFQGAFAAITCGLIVGAFAERAKFSAILVFMVIWFTFSYLPIAHMVWFWAGPDAFTDAKAGDAATAAAGWLNAKGAMDFAGGTVVHINAAVAGLVGAYFVGKRVGYGKEAMAPHSLTMTMIGASLLWVGWFGFNAGSNLEATGATALAFVNTWVATALAALVWMGIEWAWKGKPSMLGAASGAVAGLVAITPACGFVHGLKKLLGADDALDVFGVHGVGGILGALLTGVFADPALGGSGIMDYVANKVAPDYSIAAQLKIQAMGVGTTLIWSGVVAIIAFKLVDIVIGLRVPEDEEREGLDVTSHGEKAYSH
jgi:Amt family ammonium transporter